MELLFNYSGGGTGDFGGLALGIKAELIPFTAGIFDHIDFHSKCPQ